MKSRRTGHWPTGNWNCLKRRPFPRPEGPGAGRPHWLLASTVPFSRSRGPTAGRARPQPHRRGSSGEHPLCCREVWCGIERPCQVLQPAGEPSGERTHQTMGRSLYCQTHVAPAEFPLRENSASQRGDTDCNATLPLNLPARGPES
jgi:hypothetical protein